MKGFRKTLCLTAGSVLLSAFSLGAQDDPKAAADKAAPNAPAESKLSRSEEIAQSPQLDNERGFDLGWMGLLGLAGLAGLLRPKKKSSTEGAAWEPGPEEHPSRT